GHDCANVVIGESKAKQGQAAVPEHNEIKTYLDARYVTAPEATWRLFKKKMTDKSHTVYRLPVHLPNQQNIYFKDGEEYEAFLDVTNQRTKLTAWFELNQHDFYANYIKYADIPYHYTFTKDREWKLRQRNGHKVLNKV